MLAFSSGSNWRAEEMRIEPGSDDTATGAHPPGHPDLEPQDEGRQGRGDTWGDGSGSGLETEDARLTIHTACG